VQLHVFAKFDLISYETEKASIERPKSVRGDTNQVAMKMTKEAKEKAHGEQSSQQTIQDPTKVLNQVVFKL